MPRQRRPEFHPEKQCRPGIVQADSGNLERLCGRNRGLEVAMACKHDNRAGYVFCGTCGAPVAHVRCRCGFICGMSDIYCGRCGDRLAQTQRAADKAGSAAVEADGRFDLERMAALTAR